MDRVFIAIITSALLVLLGAAALLVTRTGILPHQRTAVFGISAERSLLITLKSERGRFRQRGTAGGGALLLIVDPGVPLGPELLSTWSTLPGPQIRTTNRSPRAATVAAIAVPRVEFSF